MDELEKKLESVPASPGVYLYKDQKGSIIYVGKARSLRSRVRSYFQESRPLDPKTEKLVSEIADLDYILTDSEVEALILEATLVKKNQPRYNVHLKDDKSFPYLKLTVGEAYPRIFITRRIRKDGALYFGPFLPASYARQTIKLVNKYFKLRTCNLDIDGTLPRPCLDYQMKRCLGPCVAGLCTREDYRRAVEDVKLLLSGKTDELICQLEARMDEASENLYYDAAEFFSSALKQYYLQDTFTPKEILIPADIEDAEEVETWLGERKGSRVHVRSPKRGLKSGLLDLVMRNAQMSFDTRFRVLKPRGAEVLRPLQDLLGLPSLPRRIETFDISHIQGSDTVASMVVCENGEMKKSAYRKFIVESVKGPDDFASMREVVHRHYENVLEEDEGNLPDLILIDGGKGQLAAAVAALEDLGLESQPVAAIAKKEEVLFVKGREDLPIRLPMESPVLHLVQTMRDEAHRFAVTYHRKRRDLRDYHSELDEIPGIGEVRKKVLLRAFGSLERVRQARYEELAPYVGPRAAARILEYFDGQQDPPLKNN